MRWYHFAWMKFAVVLVAVAIACEAKTMLGQVAAAGALLAIIIDFCADHFQEEDE